MGVTGREVLRWLAQDHILKTSRSEFEALLLEIAEYCCYDVKITKLVHEYGVHHRQLHYNNRFGKKLTVPVNP